MATYKVDASHSEIVFKVRHLMISNVSGSFEKFDATMTAEKDDFTDASINFEADVDSVTTNNEQRDTHLKSDDFFNAEKFPKLTFVSSSIKKLDHENYKLTGDLTMRDITKKVTLDVVYGGSIVDPWGFTRAGFEIIGKLNRKEFDLKWHVVTEAGGFVVSDDVKLLLHVEMVKQG